MSDGFLPTEKFSTDLDRLFVWRRDVRHFRKDPLEKGLLETLIERACLAPSVGNAQPWRFLNIETPSIREKVASNFERENGLAAATYKGTKANLYASLKLAGLREAPIHLAVFADTETDAGSGLGRRTMPETLAYSTVCAIYTLWLAARARGVGVGWVSILDPQVLSEDLNAGENWQFIAYLCIGYPVENHDEPELVRQGWQDRIDASKVLFSR
ncbi:MAG: 5,6-dimethylbenzimidazole synthase [Rhodobiaceae bacterium]|nr:MAG: 5,6-dimethylbenzimidazole synthase [Rhodobiaceae bacterium]